MPGTSGLCVAEPKGPPGTGAPRHNRVTTGAPHRAVRVCSGRGTRASAALAVRRQCTRAATHGRRRPAGRQGSRHEEGRPKNRHEDRTGCHRVCQPADGSLRPVGLAPSTGARLHGLGTASDCESTGPLGPSIFLLAHTIYLVRTCTQSCAHVWHHWHPPSAFNVRARPALPRGTRSRQTRGSRVSASSSCLALKPAGRATGSAAVS